MRYEANHRKYMCFSFIICNVVNIVAISIPYVKECANIILIRSIEHYKQFGTCDKFTKQNEYYNDVSTTGTYDSNRKRNI